MALDDYDRIEHARAQADKLGLIVMTPAANELFIDIDSAEDREVFERNIKLVGACLPCVIEEWPSPSGRPHRMHILVRFLSDVVLTPIERIALQACLGSDRTRETLSWRRVFGGVESPTLFFEKPNP